MDVEEVPSTEETVSFSELEGNTIKFESRQRAVAAKDLSLRIFWLLSFSVLLHYLLVAVFAYNDKADLIDAVSNVFDAWLPTITGFFGVTVTYYFTKEK